MAYETIIYEKKEGIGIITFNRPEKRNNLSLQLLREVYQVLGEIENDDEVKVVIITGDEQTFCAGADLEAISSDEARRTFMLEGKDFFKKLSDFPKPTIAAISGFCLAGGLEVAMWCDIRVASETAKIGDVHIRMGLIGGGGAPTNLTRIVGVAKAKELILTGDRIDGKEAHRIGLINQIFPPDKYLDGAMELAKKIAAHSALGLRVNKRAIDMALDMDLHQSLHYTDLCEAEIWASPEFKEKIGAFLGKGK